MKSVNPTEKAKTMQKHESLRIDEDGCLTGSKMNRKRLMVSLLSFILWQALAEDLEEQLGPR